MRLSRWLVSLAAVAVALAASLAHAQTPSVPDTPAAPTLEAQSGGRIVVSWVAPPDGGSAITAYDVQYRSGGAWTSRTVSGTSGSGETTCYSGTVTSGTSSGYTGFWQGRAGTINPSTCLQGGAQRTIVNLMRGGLNMLRLGLAHSDHPTTRLIESDFPGTITTTRDGVTVTWGSPGAMVAAGLGNYRDYSPQSQTGGQGLTAAANVAFTDGAETAVAWSIGGATPPATTLTLTGLTPGQTYEVQVRATNAAGSSPWSSSASAVPPIPDRVTTVTLPVVSLLRTPQTLQIVYTSAPGDTDTLNVQGDDTLSLSPDCDVATAAFTPPPTTVTIYPCANGSGTVEVNYAGSRTTWRRMSQVLEPRFHYTVTVTSKATNPLPQPTVLWRSLSWPLYRDGLIGEGTALVVEEGEGQEPLFYQEQGRDVVSVDLLVCPNGGSCSSTTSTLFSTPPAVGDEVYFGSNTPLSLLSVTMGTEGSRATAWTLTWEYGTSTGWETLPTVQDGTDGLTKTGTVAWNAIDSESPMAPRTVAPLRTGKYYVRATVATAGSGAHVPPVVSSAGSQSGYWSTQLRGDLDPGAATTLRVYILPLDVSLAFRRAGPPASLLVSPPADLETSVGPWRPWVAPAGPGEAAGSNVAISLPPNIAQPIDAPGRRPAVHRLRRRARL